jgi:hypothetical protein
MFDFRGDDCVVGLKNCFVAFYILQLRQTHGFSLGNLIGLGKQEEQVMTDYIQDSECNNQVISSGHNSGP